MSFLSIEHVSKTFGDYKANDDISLSIQKGKIFGLLGPNGAGKTTLIRMITRILLPDSGTILFDGKPHNDKHTERIGYMPEERGLYKNMKVYDHLVYSR
jgi:ABC-2 type transport system ATP-binding protein